jgi:hypothetical protein
LLGHSWVWVNKKEGDMKLRKEDARLTKEQWEEISVYDLPPGTLLRLNRFLYSGKEKDRQEMITKINRKYCPKDKVGYSSAKLGKIRMRKIFSGAEYNKYIVEAIIKESGYVGEV